MESLWAAAYFAGLAAEVVLRTPYNRRRRSLSRLKQHVTGSEFVVLAGVFAGTLLLPLVYAVTPWLRFADYELPVAVEAGLGSLGLMFLVVSVWLFWHSHRDLGASWSPSLEIFEGHKLVKHGVYRVVRHPMYASQLLWGIAQGLLLQNWIAGPAGLAVFFFVYLLRIPSEERMMLAHFGEEYRKYCSETGRILPRVARRSR